MLIIPVKVGKEFKAPSLAVNESFVQVDASYQTPIKVVTIEDAEEHLASTFSYENSKMSFCAGSLKQLSRRCPQTSWFAKLRGYDRRRKAEMRPARSARRNQRTRGEVALGNKGNSKRLLRRAESRRPCSIKNDHASKGSGVCFSHHPLI